MRDSIIKVKDAGKKAISMKSKFENEGKLPISINIKVSTKCCDPRLEQMLQAQHEESIKSIEKTLLQQKLDSIHLEVKLFQNDLEKCVITTFENASILMQKIDLFYETKPPKFIHYFKRYLTWKATTYDSDLFDERLPVFPFFPAY